MISAAKEYTDQQQAAIKTRQASVALSAGAGCGKTFVLTERFLSELEPPDLASRKSQRFQPADLHELIAITFTNRAAREMRDRIRQKCYQRLQAAQTERESDHWLGLMRSLDAARVSTIHSFCGSLLQAHAVEAGLDPRFTVMEQSQADTLLAEVCEDTVRERLSNKADPLHKPLINLALHFDLRRLEEMVAKLLATTRAADFEPWLNISVQEVIARWDKFRREVVLPTVLAELAQSQPAKDILGGISQLAGVTGELQKRCAALSQLLPGLPNSGNPVGDLELIIENARVKGASNSKNWPDETLYECFKAAAEKLRNKAKDAVTFCQLDVTAAQADATAGLQLLNLAKAVQIRYDDRKRELACVDNNDLLTRAHHLLTDPAFQELQQQLASQTRLLLVDECQDTDPLQVELIKALCGPQLRDGKLFFVGDYKQSIYRFRGADPSVFRHLRQEMPKQGRLALTTNFRSQPAILHFVNALFCEVLAAGNTSADRDPSANEPSAARYEPLRANWPQITAEPAVEFLWAKTESDKKRTAGAVDEARRKEADFIARRIRAMITRSEPLVAEHQSSGHHQSRPAKYGDIAILFRALSDVQFYEEALRQYDIPYYLVGGHAFYTQQEIYDVVNLLRTLASPADGISLVGVLRSPMFALADETLFWLAQHPQGISGGLFAQQLPAELDQTQRRRAQFAAETLRYLRDSKDRLPIATLLNEAFARTGYDAALLAEFMGERKLANVRKLLEQARSFDRSGVLGLADFIVQLSQFVAEMPHEPLAATHPEKTDVVRLMTIHQSKGLEFPVVFVPDMNRQADNRTEATGWHAELGPLVKLKQRGEKTPGVTGMNLLSAVTAAEDEAELIRLLYVATTRAADYLALSSGLAEQELERPKGPWLKLLAQRFNLESGELQATLPKGDEYRTPKVCVNMTLPAVDASAQSQQTWHNLDQMINSVIDLAEKATKTFALSTNGQSVKTSLRATETDDYAARLTQPVAVDLAAQQRFSVSRLNGLLLPAEEESAASSIFADENESQPTLAGAGVDLGTLVHQSLARVDFAEIVAATKNPDQLHDHVNRSLQASAGYRTELAETAAELVVRFAQSERARQLATAKQVRRELEFLLAWPPEESVIGENNLTSNLPGRYLQGFIDCLYQDAAGHWRLLDYKTNQVSAEATAALASQYELQLGVYAMAVERILGQPPAELVVHFLRPSVEHRFVWDAAMQRRTKNRVNQAIEAAVTNHSLSVGITG